MKLVDLSEVLSNRDFSSTVSELMVLDRPLKFHIVDNVLTLLAPIADHALASELELDHLLELVLAVGAILQLTDFL